MIEVVCLESHLGSQTCRKSSGFRTLLEECKTFLGGWGGWEGFVTVKTHWLRFIILFFLVGNENRLLR